MCFLRRNKVGLSVNLGCKLKGVTMKARANDMLNWAIQTNIIYEPDKVAMFKALDELGYPYQGFTAIPFSGELPFVRAEGDVVFYGSTNVINSVYKHGGWKPGVFFNDNFDYRAWCDKYKSLNAKHHVLRLRDISVEHFFGSGKQAFIRPVLDLKEFAGDVVEWDFFESWKRSLMNAELLLDCVCVVAEPFGISKEWRTFVVGGKVVGASQYREYQKLNIIPGAPGEVIGFVEEQALAFSPHEDVFVLDVGRCGDELYVIEPGCFNSAGFYACDLLSIFRAVQERVKKL